VRSKDSFLIPNDCDDESGYETKLASGIPTTRIERYLGLLDTLYACMTSIVNGTRGFRFVAVSNTNLVYIHYSAQLW